MKIKSLPEILEKTTLKLPERFQVQMRFTGIEQKLDCNISSALGQLRSLERRIAKNESLKMKYSDSIKKDLAKIYISLLEKGELERQDVWYLPHHPVVNPRKPIGPDGGDFLGNIGCSDDEDYLGENRKLIQAQGDNQQNANDVAASSQRKYSNSWLGSLMSQGNSRKDGVFGSAPVRQLSGPVSSNQGQHSKFEISDTS